LWDAVATANGDGRPREAHFVDACNCTLQLQRLLLLAESCNANVNKLL